MALDTDTFKEEEVNPAKLQKHVRELSEQLYRNVRLYAAYYISSVLLVLYYIPQTSLFWHAPQVLCCITTVYTDVYSISTCCSLMHIL